MNLANPSREAGSQVSAVRMIPSRGSALGRISVLVLGLGMLAGCGGASNTGGFSPPAPTPTANTIDVAVNSGPAFNAYNVAYVSVTVCNPGGTTTCATIPNVQVDTGSSGLRLLASAPGLSNLTLAPVTGSGSSVYECFEYNDGNYLWGQVEQADVSMAGENATDVPIQVIAGGNAPSNTTCGQAAAISTPRHCSRRMAFWELARLSRIAGASAREALFCLITGSAPPPVPAPARRPFPPPRRYRTPSFSLPATITGSFSPCPR